MGTWAGAFLLDFSSATYLSAAYLFLVSGSLGKKKLLLFFKQICRIHVLIFWGGPFKYNYNLI